MKAWMPTLSHRQATLMFVSAAFGVAVGGVLVAFAFFLTHGEASNPQFDKASRTFTASEDASSELERPVGPMLMAASGSVVSWTIAPQARAEHTSLETGPAVFMGAWVAAGLALAWITATYFLRRRVLKPLQQSRQQLAAIIDNVADGIVVLQDGCVSRINKAALDLFALEESEVRGRPSSLLMLKDPEQLQPSQDPREALIQRRDGSTTAVELSCATAASGGGVMTVLTVKDATRRHEAEWTLTQAKDVAEAAQASQSKFVAVMSHELRTPLNAVIGYAQLMQAGGMLSASQSAHLSIIEASGQHLLALVNDILDLAQNEAGRTELHVDKVNLAESIETVCDIIRIKADEAGLSLVCQLSPELPCSVVLDDRRLKQVLLNLLSNAVKFTERGTVNLDVRPIEWHGAQRVVLRFVVRDTGIGIAADQIESIFQPFGQVRHVRRRAGGTGLGLTISRQLVRLMGSDIQVTSEPGRGTEFRFDVEVPVCPWSPDGSGSQRASAEILSSCAGVQ